MRPSKNKVLFIFPSYNPEESTHYPYWYELIDEISRKLDVAILFETVEALPQLHHVQIIYSQKIRLKPFNLLERFYFILAALHQGYSSVYIHYSLWSVFLTKFISLFRKIKIYYWNCEKYEENPNNFLLALALRCCDVLVTGHSVVAESYREVFKLYSKEMKIVPLWVKSFKVKKQRFPQNKINILFVHHLSSRKGSRNLPTIIENTLGVKKDVQFHLVGGGPDLLWVKQQTRRFSQSITFYGYLPLKKVASFYRAADFFILPSRREGFPRVILEAMVYGVPYLATDVGCVRAISPPMTQRFIVPPGKNSIFSWKVLELVGLVASRRRVLSLELKKQAKKYTLNGAAEALIKALER